MSRVDSEFRDSILMSPTVIVIENCFRCHGHAAGCRQYQFHVKGEEMKRCQVPARTYPNSNHNALIGNLGAQFYEGALGCSLFLDRELEWDLFLKVRHYATRLDREQINVER